VRPRRASIGSSAGGDGGGKQASTCSQFKESLRELAAQIALTTPHYVRCLKPNDSHQPHAFDPKRIVEQLRYGGVLEAVHVARAGFPVRMQHAEFNARYGLLAPLKLAAAAQSHKSKGVGKQQQAGSRAVVEAILADLGGGAGDAADEKAWKASLGDVGMQLGLIKVFFRQKAFDAIESLRAK